MKFYEKAHLRLGSARLFEAAVVNTSEGQRLPESGSGFAMAWIQMIPPCLNEQCAIWQSMIAELSKSRPTLEEVREIVKDLN